MRRLPLLLLLAGLAAAQPPLPSNPTTNPNLTPFVVRGISPAPVTGCATWGSDGRLVSTGQACAYGQVTSIFGRAGAVTAQVGDYSAFYAALSHVHLVADVTGAAPIASPAFTGNFDASGAATTKPFTTGTATPGTCGLGQVYFDTDAVAGRNVFVCSATNTWTEINGTGTLYTPGAGISFAGTQIDADDTELTFYGSGAGAPAGPCNGVRWYFRSNATVYSCDADVWTQLGIPYTLPAPTTTVLGGVKRNTGSVGQYVTGIDTDGSLLRDTPAVGGGTTGLYSGTIDFGAIPDLGCLQGTFAATGLTTGKTLALSLPAALNAGLIGTAFPSAADTAAVRLCNVSGASVDPASATYAVREMDALGYLTASATINLTEIGDGNCLASTITLSGAAAGDNVAAGWPAALEAGLTGSMFVSAADTVAVRVCNFSGAAVDPASATFKAAITR